MVKILLFIHEKDIDGMGEILIQKFGGRLYENNSSITRIYY